MLKGRGSGILLHITCLPSRFGIGDLGPEAYRFVDFLAGSSQKYWQVLPLNPTSYGQGNSPYNSVSAFAANSLLISPELLVKEGLLEEADYEPVPPFPSGSVDYSAVGQYKERLYDRAFERFSEESIDKAGYETFCARNNHWLPNFSLFAALHRKYHGQPWILWPAPLRDRDPDAVRKVRAELGAAIEREQFLQFVFQDQWKALREYANRRGIWIIGDMPIYVDYNSADVWMNPELFRLDASLQPVVVAGVPPDYFSRTGQLWGNPLYDWDAHKGTGFSWWLLRLERALTWTDVVRIDHFRGLVAFWEVPAKAETAMGGRWVPAPGMDLLSAVKARFPSMPVIAEDLGIITPDVRDLMNRFNLPGMRVLLFAFTDDPKKNPHAPHNIPPNILLYTGTHDNAPVRGWYESGSSEEDRRRVAEYLGRGVTARDLPDVLIRLAMISAAEATIFPFQDLLCLGMEARLNTPGTTKGNWQWRCSSGMITPDLADRLRTMTRVYDRE